MKHAARVLATENSPARPEETMFLAALYFLWAGMVLGISFLETPVKFTAPSVTLAIGLDVGRHVFGAFNKVEIAFALLACGLLVASRAPRRALISLGAVMAIVALQSLWLLPLLDARVQLIFGGKTPPPAPYHWFYVVLELAKVACLLTAGVAALNALKNAAPPL